MKLDRIGYASLAIAATLAVGSPGPAAAAEKKDAASPRVVCMELYRPVCGAKGKTTKTYSNACFAKADGAKVISQGECPAATPGK